MPDTFTFEEASQPAESFTFEEADKPQSFTFEEATSTATTPQPSLHESPTSDLSSGDPAKISKAAQTISGQALSMLNTGIESGKQTAAREESLQPVMSESPMVIQQPQPEVPPLHTSLEQFKAANFKQDYQRFTAGLPESDKESVRSLFLRHERAGLPTPTADEVQQQVRMGEGSLVGISPENIDWGSGPFMGTATAIGRTASGLGEFLTSPSGIIQSVAASTGAGLLIKAKWIYDMAIGTGSSLLNLKKLIEKPDKTEEDYQAMRDNIIGATTMAIGSGLLAKSTAGEIGKSVAEKVISPGGLGMPRPEASPELQSLAPLTAQAVEQTGKNLPMPVGAQPPSPVIRELMLEGVTRPDAESLVNGTKTVKEVVEGNFQITPSIVAIPGGQGPIGHAEAFTGGYNQAIYRLSTILEKSKPADVTGGEILTSTQVQKGGTAAVGTGKPADTSVAVPPPPSAVPERVVAAAVKIGDVIGSGPEHAAAAADAAQKIGIKPQDVWEKLSDLKGSAVSGFLTSTGRFVTLDEAAAIEGKTGKASHAAEIVPTPAPAVPEPVKPTPPESVNLDAAEAMRKELEAGNKANEVVAQAQDSGVPPASIKQPVIVSENSPPPVKIDGTAEFAPPTTETPPAKSAEHTGLGAATLGEVAVQGNPDIFGIAERVRLERAKAGQTESVPPGKGIAPEASVDRGRELIRSGTSAERVMADFERTKQLSSDDMAVVRAHGEDLAERARRTEEQFGTDSPEYKEARDFLTEWDRRSKAMQTEWAKTGHAQQGETDIDTGTFTGLAREYKNQTGKDFTPKQEKVAKKRAAQKKKADAESAEAKKNLFNHLDDAGDIAAAEKRALDAANKTVRENAIRLADAETKARIAKTESEKSTADVQLKAARKAAKLAEDLARDAAVKLADAENKARIKDANRPEAIQDKAAKGAAEAADKAVRDAATKLAESENKARTTQTKREKAIAQVEIKRAKKAVDVATKAKVKAASKAAEAERKLNVARADKARFVWSKAREYIDLGIESFDEIRHKLAADLGMSVAEVTKALGQTNRAKFLTNEFWKKQQMVRRIDQQAKQWIRETALPMYRRAIESVPKILFGLKVGFHGTVALGTHAPMVAFQPTFWKLYAENFGRMYRMVGSKAFYEMKVQDLLRDKNYITARRAGLINDPFHYEDYNSPDVTKYLDKLTGMGNRGYAVLKMIRQDMFNQHWENLPRSLRQPEMAKAIADAVNHATGVVKVSAPKGANIALFAPRLEMSRVAWLLADPAIAMKTAIEWKTATRAEKYFAIQQMKEKAWVAGTFFGLLALNQGFLSLTDSKQKVNGIPEFMGGKGFNPMAGDFMKFKVAGMQLSYGNAMLTMARLPVRLYQIRSSDGGKLKNLVHPDEDTYTVLGEYARSQLSPFASLVSSLWFKADWQNRPLPSSNRTVPKRLRSLGVQPYTWPEFWSEQVLPIPFEEAAREVWHSGLGMSDTQIAQMRKAIATISIMGATGARLSDDWTLNENPAPFKP